MSVSSYWFSTAFSTSFSHSARWVDLASSTYEKMSGATMDASELIMNLGASTSSLNQVIFSFGAAPE